eukprot:1707925-Rhodomonas_salina.1
MSAPSMAGESITRLGMAVSLSHIAPGCTARDRACQCGARQVAMQRQRGLREVRTAHSRGIASSSTPELHTAHCTPHTAHCTLHTAHCTLHTAHRTLHTAHCIPHTAHRTPHTAHRASKA